MRNAKTLTTVRGHRPGAHRGPAARLLFPVLLCLASSGWPGPAAAGSWAEVLDRYRGCRQQQSQVAADLELLDTELGALVRLAALADGETRKAVEDFARGLRERGEATRAGLRRLPDLIAEIDAQVEKYRDSRTCPECIESSTFLLCSVSEELSVEASGCLRSAKELRAHLAAPSAVEPLLDGCRQRLAEVRRALDAQGALGEVDTELRAIGGALAQASAALDAGRETQGLVRVLQARQDLDRLALYVEVPP